MVEVRRERKGGGGRNGAISEFCSQASKVSFLKQVAVPDCDAQQKQQQPGARLFLAEG